MKTDAYTYTRIHITACPINVTVHYVNTMSYSVLMCLLSYSIISFRIATNICNAICIKLYCMYVYVWSPNMVHRYVL